jgi:hypothetical protein
MNLYLLNLNGAEAGPFTEQQLRALWLTGGVTVATEWRLAPQGQWRDGTELPTLLEPEPPKARETKILIALQCLVLLAIILVFVSLNFRRSGTVYASASSPSGAPPQPTSWTYDEVTMPIVITPDKAATSPYDGKEDEELCGIYQRTEPSGTVVNVFVFRKPLPNVMNGPDGVTITPK